MFKEAGIRSRLLVKPVCCYSISLTVRVCSVADLNAADAPAVAVPEPLTAPIAGRAGDIGRAGAVIGGRGGHGSTAKDGACSETTEDARSNGSSVTRACRRGREACCCKGGGRCGCQDHLLHGFAFRIMNGPDIGHRA